MAMGAMFWAMLLGWTAVITTVNTNRNVPIHSPKKADPVGTVGVTEFIPTLNGATLPIVDESMSDA